MSVGLDIHSDKLAGERMVLYCVIVFPRWEVNMVLSIRGLWMMRAEREIKYNNDGAYANSEPAMCAVGIA